MEKSHSSDSAKARSEKQQEEASRRAAPDARERIPAPAERPGPIISTLRVLCGLLWISSFSSVAAMPRTADRGQRLEGSLRRTRPIVSRAFFIATH